MAKEDVNAGTHVEITTSKKKHKGIILESHEQNITLLKLESGYNIGIKNEEIKSIKKIKFAKRIVKDVKIKQHPKLPGVAIIITGGTISSKLDTKTGAVKPLSKPEEILKLSPTLLKTVNIKKIETPFKILSENMSPKEWQKLAGITARLLNNKENKGVIITHGTDTLHYTAAALSFMLRGLNKPVILTYSQRSIDRGSSDATLNLAAAGHAALSDIAEVMVVGHATSSDNYCHAIRGTKCRKMHTSRRDTFKAINDAPLAKITRDGKVQITNKNHNKRNNTAKVNGDTAFESKVALIKAYPGSSGEIIDHLVSKKYKGIVIEGTGFGHVPKEWFSSIKKVAKKIPIIIAPQTIYGRLQPNVYSAGRELQKLGVIHCEDMLPETAYVKLGWVLGHTQKMTEIKHLMLTNIAGEINRKLTEKDFLY